MENYRTFSINVQDVQDVQRKRTLIGVTQKKI